MTKTELLSEIQKISGEKKATVENVVETMLNVMKEELQANGQITLKEFGTFQVKMAAAKTGRNPKTGEPVAIPARKVVKFKASKSLIG